MCEFHSSALLRFPRQSSLPPRANTRLVEKLKRAQAKERLAIDSAIGLDMDMDNIGLERPSQLPVESKEQYAAETETVITSHVSLDLTDMESIKSFLESVGGHDTQIVANELQPDQAAVQYMVITESNSSRGRQAIAEHFWQAFKSTTRNQQDESMRTFFLQQKQAMLQSDWLAYDLGFCFLHIMSPEARQKYRLESLWSGHEPTLVATSESLEDPFLDSEKEVVAFDTKQ